MLICVEHAKRFINSGPGRKSKNRVSSDETIAQYMNTELFYLNNLSFCPVIPHKNTGSITNQNIALNYWKFRMLYVLLAQLFASLNTLPANTLIC